MIKKIKTRMVYDNTAYLEAKAKLPKPDGKHCIICGGDLPKYKRKYCSEKCLKEWFNNIAPPRHWSEIREKALRRDKYSCVKCGKKLKKEKKYWGGYKYMGVVDHIVPIALGGEEFDLENCQTLCWDCNKKKTKKDARKIAIARKYIKIMTKGQKKIQEFPK